MVLTHRIGNMMAKDPEVTQSASSEESSIVHPKQLRQQSSISVITMGLLLLLGFGCGFIATVAVISTDGDTVGDSALEYVLSKMDRHILLHIINPEYENDPVESYFRRSTTADYVQDGEEYEEGDEYYDDYDDEDEEDGPIEFVVNSCAKDQPLYETFDDYMSPEMFARMQECLIDHPAISKNSLNDAGFNKTRGFVTRFGTESGIARFFHEAKYLCSDGFNALTPFFNASRDPYANAFVMNVLVCDKPTNKDELVVGMHVDDTLAHTLDETHQFLAHTVTVLYVRVPEDMEGGQLEVLGPDDQDLEPASVEPRENRMARFRGDSLHQVRGYHTNTKDLRVSLVLEQYHVDDEFLDNVIEYEVRML